MLSSAPFFHIPFHTSYISALLHFSDIKSVSISNCNSVAVIYNVSNSVSASFNGANVHEAGNVVAYFVLTDFFADQAEQ